MVSNRRRGKRLVVTAPVSGSLCVIDDVVIEQRSPDRITVLTTEYVVTGQSMLLILDREGGEYTSLVVDALTCSPTIVEGEFRQRVQLRPIGPQGDQT